MSCGEKMEKVKNVMDEEFNKAWDRFKDTSTTIEDIMYYKDVSRDKAVDIYHTILRYEEHGYKYDWTKPEINFDAFSNYFWSKYNKVDQLAKRLPEDRFLKYAKSGILDPHYNELVYEHRFLSKKYLAINYLVREAYYAYIANRGRFDLQCDREYVIDKYNELIKKVDLILNSKKLVYHEPKEFVFTFDTIDDSLIDSPGIIIEEREILEGDKQYSPLSFEDLYYMVSKLIGEAFRYRINREESLTNAHQKIEERIKWLESILTDEFYRRHMIDLMLLSDQEKSQFDENIYQYKKEFKKRY